MEQTVKLNLDTRQFNRGIDRATAALGAIATVATVRSLARLADTFQNITARVRVATGGGEEFAKSQAAIARITKETRGSLEATTDLFARLARSTRDTAITTDQLAVATTAINQAIKVSGASSLEANAAIIQLGQGLASGALRGDELRSVLEQTPRLARAIANGLGVSIGKLRELGTEGKLTTEVVLAALQREAPKIAEEFAQIPPTIADAFTALDNAILLSTQTLNKAGFGAVLEGIAKGSAAVIEEIGKAFEAILPSANLRALSQDIELAFLDTTRAILKGVQQIKPVLDPIFETVKIGINNLINFFNSLPPGVQQLGIIGFFLIGRTAKVIVVAVAAVLKDVARLFDSFFSSLLEAQNATIRGINIIREKLGFEPMDLIVFDPNQLEKGLEKIGFANGLLDEQGIKLKQIGDQETTTNKIIEQSIKNIEKHSKLIRESVGLEAFGGAGAGTSSVDTTPIVLGTSEKELKKQQEALQKKFDKLQESLFTEEEAEKASFNRQLETLDAFYKGREMRDVTYFKLREKLETRHQKRLAAIAKQEVQDQVSIFKSGQFQNLELAKLTESQKLEFTKQAGMSVLTELGKQNKAAFQAAKALNIANAIMNTAAGATKALAQGGVFGPILAGLVVAAGAVQIAAIQSQKFQGRKTGGLVQKGKPFMVGESGTEMFIPNQTGTIIPNRNLDSSGQTVNVNFNINTVDAAGVDELLVSRRATITNIIRDAASQKGQRSPV